MPKHHHKRQRCHTPQENIMNPLENTVTERLPLPQALGSSFEEQETLIEEIAQDESSARIQIRESREAQTARSSREEEERLNQSRAFLQNLYPDRLYFPKEEIPEQMDYRWIREEVQGSPDRARITVMTRKGWTPVPASRHPNFLSDRTWNGTLYKEDVIRVQGLILCERPKELGKIEDQTLKARNQLNRTAVNWSAGEIGIKERRVLENSFSYGAARS